jgi:hypothetical protein
VEFQFRTLVAAKKAVMDARRILKAGSALLFLGKENVKTLPSNSAGLSLTWDSTYLMMFSLVNQLHSKVPCPDPNTITSQK